MKYLGLLAFLATAIVTTSAQACPDWQQPPAFGTIELYEYFPNDPYTRRITAGGHYSLAGCFNDASFSGSVARKPDFDLYYRTSGATTLTIMVQSSYDTMLLVNDPQGNWLFDDDGAGDLNPMIRIPKAQDGLYDIWIGSFQGGRGLPGTLVITELR